MMRPLLFAAAAALTTVGAGGVIAAPAKKAAPADWTRTVVETPQGGFRMGNPAAKVKVVEYGSLTCSHCRDFSKASEGPLAAHIKSGKVSFEYRNMVLNIVDMTASLLARCGGPSKFFPLAGRMYATQDQWVGKISGVSQAQQDQLNSLAPGERLASIANIGGLTQLAAQAGIPAARARQCLADPAGHKRLGDMYKAATALGIEGTPTFFINGSRVKAHDWSELQPLIKRAGG
jgi:protein-disulfide isomerase